MILISSDVNDQSTNDVIDWLKKYKYHFIRINKEDVSEIDLKFGFISIMIGKFSVKLDDISFYWYRKGHIGIKRFINSQMQYHEPYLHNENKVLNEYINYNLSKNSLGDYYNSEPNKLIILDIAQKCGLKIPESFIIDNKKELLEVLHFKKLITKVITASGKFYFNDSLGGLIFTNEVTGEFLKDVPDFFYPSFFQEMVEKKYEIRSFILGKKIWSMAIFSQSEEYTKVDFRKDNNQLFLRRVPVNLPLDIEDKIFKLFKELKLKTGSVDIIVSKRNEYYFLELNPVGQFGMVSFACNYNIEEEITRYLIRNGK